MSLLISMVLFASSQGLPSSARTDVCEVEPESTTQMGDGDRGRALGAGDVLAPWLAMRDLPYSLLRSFESSWWSPYLSDSQ